MKFMLVRIHHGCMNDAPRMGYTGKQCYSVYVVATAISLYYTELYAIHSYNACVTILEHLQSRWLFDLSSCVP
jgi:hypothetical protein